MARICLLSSVAMLLMTRPILAQTAFLPASVPDSPLPIETLFAKISVPPLFSQRTVESNRFDPCIWSTVEYLGWRIRDGALPQITTTPNPSLAAFPGAFGQSGTSVVAGGKVDLGWLSGGRVSLGGWFCDVVGAEASGFVFQQQVKHIGLASDAVGNPYLSFPIFRSDANREGAFSISDPTVPQSGSVQMSLTTQLWGAEANLLIKGYRSSNLAINGIVGFRYADLKETAQIRNDASYFVPGQEFQQTLVDNFMARNQFCGLQAGTQLEYGYRRFSLGLAAKIAVGANQQTVAISGRDTQSGPGAFPAAGTLNEGFFAQASNIGRFTDNHFSVLPQVQAKVSYDLCRNVSAFVGYDALYWTGVVRAGDQIDRNINFTQSQVFGTGLLTGRADPSPAFRRSDFLAQGVNFGITFRY